MSTTGFYTFAAFVTVTATSDEDAEDKLDEIAHSLAAADHGTQFLDDDPTIQEESA